MLFVALAGGLGLVALPVLAHRGGRRLDPSEWARLCVVAVAGGAVVVELSLVLYASPTLARASGIPRLAQLCERMLAPLTPGGPAAGWTAALAATALPVLAVWGWVRARVVAAGAHVERGVGRHGRFGGYRLVVLPTSGLVAVSVPAVPGVGGGQIVVSEGLLGVLAPGEAAAVLAHEAAHLRHGHHRYLMVAAALDRAFVWFPPARRSTAVLRLALERWADEDAAGRGEGERVSVRDALLAVTASLVGDPPAAGAVAAFSTAETIGERLDALDGGPPRPLWGLHLLVYCPGAALGAVVVGVLSWWASGAGEVLAMAGQCTS